MSRNFWKELEKPIIMLAPMADVTDAAFRRMFAKYGKPDVMYTEFVSVDALLSEGRKHLLRDFLYTEPERPIVAQIFGSDPDKFKEVGKMCLEMGFDGVDINMGCPERKIQKQNACAALIKEPALAKEIVYATKEGARTESGGIPVSVKTRIGYNREEIETWVPHLLETKPAALIMHGRTKKEMSKVDAHWDAIKRTREIRDEEGSEVLVIGNGDVKSLSEARKKVDETGVDGVMVGRGAFGNPWFFNEDVNIHELSLGERFRVMVEHSRLFEELVGDIKNFAIMRKHFKAYVEGFRGAKELRVELMIAKTAREVEEILQRFNIDNEENDDLDRKIL